MHIGSWFLGYWCSVLGLIFQFWISPDACTRYTTLNLFLPRMIFRRGFSFFRHACLPARQGFTRLHKLRYGFTLIEILLVIGIVAILASIVIAAINPGKQLADARNTTRRSDVQTFLNALYQYAIDYNGNFPPALFTGATGVCTSGTQACSSYTWQICNNTKSPSAPCKTTGKGDLADLKNSLLPKYLTSVPSDPSLLDATAVTATGTNYFMFFQNGRITVFAPAAENGATISVSR